MGQPPPPPPPADDRLASYFRCGETMRSRSVGNPVLTGTLPIPVPPARLQADWARELSLHLHLETGDVEALPLARARARWPDYRLCVQALSDWMRRFALHEVLASSEVALMACRGARYHHDGAQYGGAAFCNLFLSEDKGLDLHFPVTGQRVALARGTAVVFDTGQPHAVVARGRGSFDPHDFPADQDCTQVFLSWELPVLDTRVAQALGIRHDIDPATCLLVGEDQVWRNGAPAILCPQTGRWQVAD